MIFDIAVSYEDYLPYDEVRQETERLGFEAVPSLGVLTIESLDMFEQLIDRESSLGGAKIEGVVVKNYLRFGRDGKAIMGKFVSERYRETHEKAWKSKNPSQLSVLASLCQTYRSEQRWEKAIQHRKEDGELQNAPQDIGPLMKLIQADLEEECEDEIKNKLFKWAKGPILRTCVAGFPEWYKRRLLGAQFNVKSGES